MRIILETPVKEDFNAVWKGFDRELFISLAPGFPKLVLKRFDGCNQGDEVHLELEFPFFKQSWNSLIIESGRNDREYYFIDQGTQLPFFLTYWEHKHRIVKSGNETVLVDDIQFKSHGLFMEWLIYPSLWLSFFQRKSKYQNRFGKP